MKSKPALVLFGSYNERMVRGGGEESRHLYPGLLPGAVIRRATGTPFMGYAGATYVMQEYCNALFDALFHILPLGTELDRVDPTPARPPEAERWDEDALALLHRRVETEPFLLRISAAKRWRERVEAAARRDGEDRISAERVARCFADAALETAG